MEDGEQVVVRSVAYILDGKPVLSFRLGESSVAICYPPTDEGERDVYTILDSLDQLIESLRTELEFARIVQEEKELGDS